MSLSIRDLQDMRNEVDDLQKVLSNMMVRLGSIEVKIGNEIIERQENESKNNVPDGHPANETLHGITMEEFEAYEEVRVGGRTNMMMISNVATLSALSKEKVKTIIEHYDELEKFYPEVRK